MMRYKFDIVIIGGGIYGASIFYNLLTRTNKRVALLEKKRFCNGATGSSGGFIRALHQSQLLTELAHESLTEFNHFEKHVGMNCDFIKTGFFTIETKTSLPVLTKKLQWLSQQGSAIEYLSHYEARGNSSSFNLPINDDEVIIYERNAGYADPIKATHAYISAGIKCGGFASENIELLDILTHNGKIIGAKTPMGIFETPCIVLAAGAWCITLLNKMGLQIPTLTTKAIQINFYRYTANTKQIPTFFDKISGLYGRNYQHNSCLLGTANELKEESPELNSQLDNQINQQIHLIAPQRIPYFSEMIWQGGRRAVDAYTDNYEGITKFIDEISGLFVCTGWSGLGFKIAPACAKRIVAQLDQSWN